DLDADTDRIWAERHRIVGDKRELAGQLAGLADSAAERFPPADDPEGQAVPYDDQAPEDDRSHDSYQAPEDAPMVTRAHDSYQAPEDDQAHDSYQAREDDEGDATVAFAAVESGSDDEPGAELAYEDAAAEPDYGDAATQPNYGNAATQRDAAADLAYEDAAAGLDSGGAAGTPPPVAADERPGEHD